MDGEFMNPETVVLSFGVKEGMKIADFGTGAGHFAILMAKMVGENGLVTAIDVLENALETVSSKAKLENLNNLKTIRSDLEVVGSSGLADGSQDFVLIKNMLFQSTHRSEVIKEASRVLKPGSGLVVIDWKKDAGGMGPPNESRCDSAEIQKMAEQSGFVLINPIDPDSYHFGFLFKKN